jgi:hypothetical protein
VLVAAGAAIENGSVSKVARAEGKVADHTQLPRDAASVAVLTHCEKVEERIPPLSRGHRRSIAGDAASGFATQDAGDHEEGRAGAPPGELAT